MPMPLFNAGEFCMELLPQAAPATVANFLRYVDNGGYAAGRFAPA